MFTDGVSLPGLSEKVMYQTCFDNLQYPDKKTANAFQFPANRLCGYKSQDVKAKRDFGMTVDHLNTLLQKQKYPCGLCYCQLTTDTASADRINNKLGHIDGNILISCVKCNTARKDMSSKGFRYKKLLEFNSDRLVYSIDKEEKNIYTNMKANIAGDPSIIFNRYAKRNETKIRGGKLCKKVIGYDANALYLWALGNDMPCGRLTTIETYPEIVEDIKNDKIFGFLECDIHTPEHLNQYFGEMTPIFKNTLFDCTDESIIGKHMYDYNQAREKSRSKPARKLIGSYLERRSLSTRRCSSGTYRMGDADESKAMMAEMMKLVGNSSFGRSGMDMSKHKEIKYESSDKAIKAKIEHFTFHGLEELNDACELTMMKRKLKNKNPIHLSIAIYQLAKLRMLQFYYDCIDIYFDRSDSQYQEMDTDSAYIAFSCDNPFQDCINLNYVSTSSSTSDAMVSLSSKNYICYLPDDLYKVKVSAKGVQQGRGRNNDVLSPKGFETVVRDRITLQGTNKGFRLSKETKSIITYSQTKTALSRQVLSRLYYDPKTGYINAQALHEKARELDPKITLKNVKDCYATQSVIQRFQEQKQRFDGFKIASHNPNSWQIDLAFWGKQPILTGININSRIGYANLLSNKTAATVLVALKAFIRCNKVDIITSDNGSEFMNSKARQLFKANKIEHYNNEPGDHGTMGKIERFNRTLKQRLTKMSPKRITHKLISDVITNYNTTTHRSIGMTHNEAKGKVIEAELNHNQVEADKIDNELEVGTNVLNRLKKKTF
ncbi:unnamed protein product [Phytophthora lilii]|uniref:Unnamed protein product n=1 Tax=Phytophthora lilii TaxID=2077276 RepID=A0A9W6T882_9STRA|nr:unnamed protein product [Phytophthora lilii]